MIILRVLPKLAFGWESLSHGDYLFMVNAEAIAKGRGDCLYAISLGRDFDQAKFSDWVNNKVATHQILNMRLRYIGPRWLSLLYWVPSALSHKEQVIVDEDTQTEEQWKKLAEICAQRHLSIGTDPTYKVFFCPNFVEGPRVLF